MPRHEVSKKRNFILDHEAEITPITDDRGIFSTLKGGEIAPEGLGGRLDKVIAEFETRVYTLDKGAPGKSILLTTDHPGSYTAVGPLVKELLKDESWQSISVLASGLASKHFDVDFGGDFRRLEPDRGGVLGCVISVAARRPLDVVIGTVGAGNGPETLAMFGGKSNLGAKRLFYIVEGWGGIGGVFCLNRQNMDPVDGIFCNDQLAKRLIHKHLPDFPQSRIMATGTPGLGALEQNKAKSYREEARRRLGLAEDVFALLYVGDVNSDYPPEKGFDSEINEKTFELTRHAFYEFASKHPNQNFGFMFRWHPRDPNKDLLAQRLNDASSPSNVKSVLAVGPEFNMNQTAYAADVIASIISTENIFAQHRNRHAIYLSYKTDSDGLFLGEQAVRNNFGDKIIRELSSEGKVNFVYSTMELVSALERLIMGQPLGVKELSIPNYSRIILDKIVASLSTQK